MTEPTIDFVVPEKDVLNGLYLAVPDFDAEFRSLEKPPRLINDFSVATKEQRKAVNDLLVTEYKSDTLETVPSCDCGCLSGGINLGKECTSCYTVVAHVTEKPIQPVFWIKVPEGVTGFILPAFWSILVNSFSTKQTCIMSWLVNSKYSLRGKTPKIIERLMALNLPRGLNNFIEHFDMIMDTLIEKRFFKDKSPERIHLFREYISENRDKLFPTVMPLPPSLNFIKESTPTGTYTDENIMYALDAIWTICSLYTPGVKIKQNVAENSTFKVTDRLATYYKRLWARSLSTKPGIPRKHICGGSPDWSFRAVITSIHGVHDHRELHIPWSLAMVLYREHLMSMLLRAGWVYNDATMLLFKNMAVYNRKLHDMLNAIIHAPVKEILPNAVCVAPIQPIGTASVIFQRN